MNDELARARAGDVHAFAELVRGHQRSVYSLALRMLCNREAAEDLSQDVFLELHRRLAGIESAGHLAHWLRRVVVHRAIDLLRSPSYVHRGQSEEMSDLAAPMDDDPILWQQLRALLDELPPAARAVMLLRYQEDLDPLEISSTLAMPINTVKSHLKRSLAALRLRLRANDCAMAGG